MYLWYNALAQFLPGLKSYKILCIIIHQKVLEMMW